MSWLDELNAEASHALAFRRVQLPRREMVFLRDIIEASEGLATLVARPGEDGALLFTSESQAAELDRLLGALGPEIGLRLGPTDPAFELAYLKEVLLG